MEGAGFENGSSYEERRQLIIEEALNAVADEFIDGRNPYNIYSIHPLTHSETVFRYQPCWHNIADRKQAHGPSKELVDRILENAVSNLEIDYPSSGWREAMQCIKTEAGSYIIEVDTDKLL